MSKFRMTIIPYVWFALCSLLSFSLLAHDHRSIRDPFNEDFGDFEDGFSSFNSESSNSESISGTFPNGSSSFHSSSYESGSRNHRSSKGRNKHHNNGHKHGHSGKGNSRHSRDSHHSRSSEHSRSSRSAGDRWPQNQPLVGLITVSLHEGFDFTFKGNYITASIYRAGPGKSHFEKVGSLPKHTFFLDSSHHSKTFQIKIFNPKSGRYKFSAELKGQFNTAGDKPVRVKFRFKGVNQSQDFHPEYGKKPVKHTLKTRAFKIG